MFSSIGYIICIPFAWLVRLFYTLTGSYGLAIILFTLVVKLIMLPFQVKSKKSMMRMNRMNGKIQEIQKKYANNQAKMGEEMQKLYAEEGVSPMSGCLWSFLPLPILLALYSIMRQPITHLMMISKDTAAGLVEKAAAAGVDITNIATVKDGVTQFTAYGQINLVKAITSQAPEVVDGLDKWIHLDFSFIGLDLAATPTSVFGSFSFSWAVIGLILIPILAGGFQLLMSIYTMRTQPQQGANGASMKGMMYMMPLMSVYIAFIMPAALGIYWIAQSVFSLIQEVIMTKFFNKKLEEEENARYEARQADRQRRQEEAKRLQEEQKKQAAQKQTLKQKQKAAQAAKAAKAAKAGRSTTEAGRVGDRPYARGRSYKADRYDD
ncbi:membrane protein insertase YidC [Oscillibacter valericigenes]|uniref:YidC/Oxa1 family membrane protein insertase n=1 Tax=Oscillibacter valericigenes TaxID=351091 RepID=UPI001F2A0896|nr:YidC/Oxa1 family membrane protein insertase [Oscillibacter valericigenes]MCF2616209.1 membrane protein insertase YidC [Oscillibacter valericigenes]